MILNEYMLIIFEKYFSLDWLKYLIHNLLRIKIIFRLFILKLLKLLKLFIYHIYLDEEDIFY
jgi:hypothetical protein